MSQRRQWNVMTRSKVLAEVERLILTLHAPAPALDAARQTGVDWNDLFANHAAEKIGRAKNIAARLHQLLGGDSAVLESLTAQRIQPDNQRASVIQTLIDPLAK